MAAPPRITLFAPATGSKRMRALADDLAALGHDAAAMPLDRQSWALAARDAAVCVVASACLPLLDAAIDPDGPQPRAAAWLTQPGDAVFTAHVGAVVAADAACVAAGRQAGFAAETVYLIEPGVPDLPRSDGPGKPGCVLLGSGDHDTLSRALTRLADLDWTLHLQASGEAAPPLPSTIVARVRSGTEIDWQDVGILVQAQRGAPDRDHHHDDDDDAMLLDEALARGIPVALAGDAARQAHLPPEAGALAPPGDHAALSLALRRMIFDTALRRAMADAAVSYAGTLPRRGAQALRFATLLEGLP